MSSINKLAACVAAVSLFVPAVAAAALAPASAPTPGAKPTTTKPATAAKHAASDKAQIEALEKSFIAAFNAKSVARIMAGYAKDGLFVFDVSPPREYVGWAAYKKDWEDTLGMFPGPIKVTLSELSVTVVGPVAYGHSIQAAEFTAKDGSKFAMTVRVSDVYRKIGGKWKIVQEHVSVPVDLGTQKPDLTSKP